MSFHLQFECRSAAAPKKFPKFFRASESPQTLADMLVMLRKMGFKPEDIYVGPVTFETTTGHITFG